MRVEYYDETILPTDRLEVCSYVIIMNGHLTIYFYVNISI